MKKYNLNINGKEMSVTAETNKPLLWVIREDIGLTGAKYSCGQGLCGVCTVLLNGKAVRSCSVSIKDVPKGAKISTIEGLPNDHLIFKIWEKLQVAQCGYCQPGQILTTLALLSKNKSPTDEDIDDAMSEMICRCGTYPRIKNAVKLAVKELK